MSRSILVPTVRSPNKPNGGLKLGEIRVISASAHSIRVVSFDHIVVYYETTDAGLLKEIGRLRVGCGFPFEAPTAYILRESRHVQFTDFTEEDYKKYRPDLPLRFWRYRQFSWPDSNIAGPSLLKEMLVRAGINPEQEPSIAAPELALYPVLKNGFSKKPAKVRAKDGHKLTSLEVLWGAYQVHAVYKAKLHPCEGIGLFRVGYEKGLIPSYYVGGFYDLGGCIEYYEKNQDQSLNPESPEK